MTPTLDMKKADTAIRILGMGDPGTGKTGSLAALINELPRWGIKRVIIQDWDNGLDILSAKVNPDKQSLVHYATLRDEMKATQEGVKVRENTALKRGMALMNNWKLEGEDLGNCNSWGLETLFVCDTLTGLGDACLNFAVDQLKINSHWKAVGEGMKIQGDYVQLLVALK